MKEKIKALGQRFDSTFPRSYLSIEQVFDIFEGKASETWNLFIKVYYKDFSSEKVVESFISFDLLEQRLELILKKGAL